MRNSLELGTVKISLVVTRQYGVGAGRWLRRRFHLSLSHSHTFTDQKPQYSNKVSGDLITLLDRQWSCQYGGMQIVADISVAEILLECKSM